MAKQTKNLKALLRSRGKQRTIEFLGIEWRMRKIPVYDIPIMIAGAEDEARALAIEQLRPQKAELEKQPILEDYWKATIANAGDQEVEKPKSRYEQMLDIRVQNHLLALIGTQVLTDQEGTRLAQYAGSEDDKRELLEAILSEPSLIRFINSFIGQIQSSSEKNS